MSKFPWIPELRLNETRKVRTLLDDPFADRILIYGDPGSGRRSMITAVLQDYDGPTLKVVCSRALMDVPLSTLAPLLDSGTTASDELDAFRRVKAVLSSRNVNGIPEKKPLLVLFDAEFLDPSSAFVLGQLVDAKLLRLLIVSTLRAEQNESLRDTNALHYLHEVENAPLDLAGIAQLCRLAYGVPLTSAGTLAIYGQCFGNLSLTWTYLQTARRQKLLFQKAGQYHLRWHELAFEPEQALVVQEVHQQLPAESRAVLETLAFVDQLSSRDFAKISSNQRSASNWTSLVRQTGGFLRLSPYYATGLRGSLPMARRDEVCATLKRVSATGETEYGYSGCIPSLDNSISASARLREARAANDSMRPYVALRVIYEGGEENRTFEEHMEAIRAFLILFQPQKACAAFSRLKLDGLTDINSANAKILSATIDWTLKRSGGSWPGKQQWDSRLSQALAHQSSGDILVSTQRSIAKLSSSEWSDKVWIRHLQTLDDWWEKGQIARLSGSEAPKTGRTLVPVMVYQLASLVKRVQALTLFGELDRARQLVTSYRLDEPATCLHSSGTVEFLHGFIACARGEYLLAGNLYAAAAVQLSVHDPESLLEYCYDQMEYIHELLRPSSISDLAVDRSDVESTVTPVNMEPGVRYLAKVIQNDTGLAMLNEIVAPDGATDGATVSKPIVLQCILYYLGLELYEKDFQVLHELWLRLVPEPGAGTAAIIPSFMKARLASDMQRMEECIHLLEHSGNIPLAIDAVAQVIHLQASMGDVPDGTMLLRLHRLIDQQDASPRGIVGNVIQKFGLTPRERLIVELIRGGASNSQIAGELTLSQRTVEGHVYRIFQKLSLGKRSELGALQF